MTTTEIDARAALSAAIQNEATHHAALETARATLEAAKAKRQTLVSAAATSGAGTADLHAAAAEIKEVSLSIEIAESVHVHSVTLRHEAEIAAWHAEAANLAALYAEAKAGVIRAGAGIDTARTALENSLADYSEAAALLTAAYRRATLFNDEKATRVATNPVLAAAELGTGPLVRGVDTRQVRKFQAIVFEPSGWSDVGVKDVRNIAGSVGG